MKLNETMMNELFSAVEYNSETNQKEDGRNQRLLKILEDKLNQGRTDLNNEEIQDLFLVLLENDISRFDTEIETRCDIHSGLFRNPSYSVLFQAL